MSTLQNLPIFICYSRKDKRWLPKLQEILKEYPNVFIDESEIPVGQKWDTAIGDAIAKSQIAICLVSEDFFKSDYILDHELPRIEKKAKEGNIKIIPILLKGWENGISDSFLSKCQYLNDKGYIQWPEDLYEYSDKLKSSLFPLPAPSRPILPVSNLPERSKWFMGYEGEKEKLKQHILSGNGLIAITGAPRTGRRTLAKLEAHELFDNGDLPGGVVWIDCQKIDDERALITTIGEVYLKSRAPEDIALCQQVLEDEFSKKRCLIILGNTENPRAEFFERWAKKIPSPSVVIDVTALFARPEGVPYIHLRGLDDKNAEALFITVASEALGTEKPFTRHTQFDRIREICRETRNNPLLIEIYANKCGQGLLLDDILNLAHSNRDTDTITIWKIQLEPLFSALEEEHRAAFLKLCRLPDGVSGDLVQEITGLEPKVLGPAIKKQFLWDLGYQRYMIDPSVRTFAETKLTCPTIQVDGEVAVAFARIACAKAAQIELSLGSDRQALDESVEWFMAEWENLKYCVGVAEHIGDKETVCRLADSILQFMIRRGRYEDSLILYEKALSFRDNDDLGRSRTLNDMAVCLQFMGKYPAARKHIEKSIKLRQELIEKSDSPSERCELMFRLAQSWNTCGAINLLGKEFGNTRLVDAAKAFKAATQICEQASEIAADEAIRTKIEIEQSQTLSNLGYCFTKCGHQTLDPVEKKAQFEKALKAFNDSIAIKRPGDEREGQTFSRRGQLRLEQSLWPLAEKDFNEAISIFEFASNTFELGLAHFGRGRVRANKPTPNYDGSIKDFKRAEELFEELRDRENQFCVLMELAKIEKERGNPAEDYATKAYYIADKPNLEKEQIEAQTFLENLQT